MSVPVIAFFNNKGGVGKTSLVYHLSWMFQDLDVRVLAADLDPQANLTAAFQDEDQVLALWPEEGERKSIFGCLQPLMKGTGDIGDPSIVRLTQRLALMPGDLALSLFEDDLSNQWPRCLERDERAFRVTSAFWRVLQAAASDHHAEVILADLGPNLGALNRAGLVASDFVVVPLSPDLFSLQGLRNLGPRLRDWRSGWKDRLDRKPRVDFPLPAGEMCPVGYVVLQHAVRADRPVRAYRRWVERIPSEYRVSVLGEADPGSWEEGDANRIALIKHYRSLMPMAQDARKPVFHLTAADGALGAHATAAKDAFRDFRELARAISERTGVARGAFSPTSPEG